ncbi:MAG: hypothetical protein ACI9FN_000176 [Saprospiraceae bacterium]
MRCIKSGVLGLVLCLVCTSNYAQVDQVRVLTDSTGSRLIVNGDNFMINGMNWDYYPIGVNFTYSLWSQPNDIIIAALDYEMSLLRDMGVNAVRQYTGIPARWIEYIYDTYGIYTMLNHSFGRYGLNLDEQWVAKTDYRNSRVKEFLLEEVTEMVLEFRGTRGLLMYLLGNENNYGLFWEGAETEDIPLEDQKSSTHARSMYRLFNQAAAQIKNIDINHPVAICNGDLQFLELIVEECKDVDIFGTNIYRGRSFGDAFQRVKSELKIPIMFTEFGADALNAIDNSEDQLAQAHYVVSNWKEIYANAAGLGKANNSIGGFTFQFSDGWWKYGQTINLDIHDNNASWSNGGYERDYKKGENNMNEEWFGICAKGSANEKGLYKLNPRAAYYALKKVHLINPYDVNTSQQTLEGEFSKIKLK